MDDWSLMRGDAFIHFVCGSRRVNIRLGVLSLIPKSPQPHYNKIFQLLKYLIKIFQLLKYLIGKTFKKYSFRTHLIHVVNSISFQTFLYRHLKLSYTLENSVSYCLTSCEMTDQVLGFQLQMNSYSSNWNTPY